MAGDSCSYEATAAAVSESASVALALAPSWWVDRPDDLRAMAQGLGLEEGYRAPLPNSPGRVFSITGMCGVGKSALTRRLFDMANPNYTSRPAVRVEFGETADNRAKQQEILNGLGAVFKEGDNLQDELVAALSARGYLLILDDLWGLRHGQRPQLEELFGPNWKELFTRGTEASHIGSGSCVLLSSQEALLGSEGNLHSVGCLDSRTAEALFCKLAFPPHGLANDTLPWKRIVEGCGGLPFALVVIGESLVDQDTDVWQSTTNDLISTKVVRERLSIPYNLLPEHAKMAFVDIANFWKDQPWSLAKAAFKHEELAILKRNSLIEERETVVYMHDLLEDMGMQIADENRSWLEDPLPHIVAMSKPRGLVFQFKQIGNYENGMEDVRVLLVRNCYPKLNLKRCQELRYLLWEYNLPALEVRGQDLLPDGIPSLVSLLLLKVKGWSSLKSLPDGISNLISLQTLRISGCSGLAALPDGISSLSSLQTLELSSCSGLGALPDGIGSLSSLQTLIIEECNGLGALPDSIGSLSSLQTLHLSKCSRLAVLPDGMGSLISLQTLQLYKCSSLGALPDCISSLSSLQMLSLYRCSGLAMLPNGIGSLSSLQTLSLYGCSGLAMLPNGIGSLSSLQTLDLCGCSGLAALPDGIGSLSRLQTIDLSQCRSLAALPDGIGSLSSLQKLDISQCDGLAALPLHISSLSCLYQRDAPVFLKL